MSAVGIDKNAGLWVPLDALKIFNITGESHFIMITAKTDPGMFLEHIQAVLPNFTGVLSYETGQYFQIPL